MPTKIADEEKDKRSTLQKITDFFKAQPKAEVVADEEDPEEKKADDEEDTSMTKADDEEQDDPDDAGDDSDDDSDPDKDDDDDAYMEVNGETINLKNVEEVRACIEKLQGINAQQNELLQEAAAELGKTKEQVKNDIKSTFVPPSSKRSTKTVATKTAVPSFAIPEKGSIAARAAALANAKSKK